MASPRFESLLEVTESELQEKLEMLEHAQQQEMADQERVLQDKIDRENKKLTDKQKIAICAAEKQQAEMAKEIDLKDRYEIKRMEMAMASHGLHKPQEIRDPFSIDDIKLIENYLSKHPEQEPEGIRCPTSNEIMRCPIFLDVDGRTYDKYSLQSQLAKGNLASPQRREPFNKSNFKANYDVIATIQAVLNAALAEKRLIDRNNPFN